MSNEVRVALISTVGGIAIALIGQGIFFPPPTDKPDLLPRDYSLIVSW